MKAALINYNPEQMPINEQWHPTLILETPSDVHLYMELEVKKQSTEFMSFWFDAKKSDISHAASSRSGTIKALATMIQCRLMSEKDVSLMQACKMGDSLLNSKYTNMLQMINNGERVKVNAAGGYCNLTDMFVTRDEIDITEQSLKEYVYTGVQKETFSIVVQKGHNMLVLENAADISDELHRFVQRKLHIHESFYKKVTVVKNLKERTEGISQMALFTEFSKVIDAGIDTIFAETTMFHKEQFDSMVELLKSVMSQRPDKKLLVYLKLVGSDTELNLDLPENIKLEMITV